MAKKSSTTETNDKKHLRADAHFPSRVGRPGLVVGNIARVGKLHTTTSESLSGKSSDEESVND